METTMNDTRQKADSKTTHAHESVPSIDWPFPPPGGPKPWTPAQQRADQRKQLQQTEDAPW